LNFVERILKKSRRDREPGFPGSAAISGPHRTAFFRPCGGNLGQDPIGPDESEPIRFQSSGFDAFSRREPESTSFENASGDYTPPG